VYRYFDYMTVAREAGISQEDLAALRRRVESEYRNRMLRELHLHILCRAIASGQRTLAEALQPSPRDVPPPSKLTIGG